MWRGTTPTHIFTLPVGVKLTDFSAVFITYSQNGETILEKTEADLTPTETGFTVTLPSLVALVALSALVAGGYTSIHAGACKNPVAR